MIRAHSNPQNCGYVTLHGKRGFADMNRAKDFPRRKSSGQQIRAYSILDKDVYTQTKITGKNTKFKNILRIDFPMKNFSFF